MTDQNNGSQENMPEKRIQIDEQTAFNMKLLEFNKLISEAKASASNLEAERDKYIYESNINSIVAQYESKNKEENSGKDEPPQDGVPAPVANPPKKDKEFEIPPVKLLKEGRVPKKETKEKK